MHNPLLTTEGRLAIITGRLERLHMSGAALPDAPPISPDDVARLHQLVEGDAPWLLTELRRLVAEQAADRRRIRDLQNRLGEAEAKIHRQAGALAAWQLREGRRQVRGR